MYFIMSSVIDQEVGHHFGCPLLERRRLFDGQRRLLGELQSWGPSPFCGG